MSDELIAQLRAKLDNLGVKYHHSHNVESLEAMLAEAESRDDPKSASNTDPAPEEDAKPEEDKAVSDEPVTAGLVRVRVTKWGAGQISTGEAAKPFFKRDDVIHVPPVTAESYESKYFAEILDD